MALPICPKCGHETDGEASICPRCGQGPRNGALPVAKPAAPSEVSVWVRYPTPPELVEWAKQTCHEEEFAAALHEVEQTGGLELKDFIRELEEGAPVRD